MTVIILYKKIIDKLNELTKNLNKQKHTPKKETSHYLSVLAKIRKNKIKNAITSVLVPIVFTISSAKNSELKPPEPTTTQASEPEPAKEQPKSHLLNIRENKNPNQKRFAQQMVLINLITCVSSVFSILTNVQVIFPFY